MVHIRNRVVVPIDSLELVGKPHRIAISEACHAYIQGCSDLYQGVGSQYIQAAPTVYPPTVPQTATSVSFLYDWGLGGHEVEHPSKT